MTRRTTLSRRELLWWTTLLSATSVVGLPRKARAAGQKTLILVELKGGNDGLNTLAPVKDPLYRKARPSLALDEKDAVRFAGGVFLHPALAPLVPLVEQGELAAVLNVGYPKPNRSHFRSIEIWDQASDSDDVLDDGWVTRALTAGGRDKDALASVLVESDPGPLTGAHTLGLDDEDALRRLASPKAARTLTRDEDRSPALRHLVALRRDLQEESARVLAKVDDVRVPAMKDERLSRMRRATETAAKLVAADLGVPTLRLTVRGFDTHRGQARGHTGPLTQLAVSIASLRAALQEIGAWDRVLVVVTSEFGRRVAENKSGGTDHGAACPVLLIGRGVKPGLHGTPYALDALHDGDLVPTTLHRDVFAAVAARVFGAPAAAALSPTPMQGLFTT